MSVKIDELFYELEMRTQGFDESLKRSEKSLAKFTTFVKGNPILVMGALGAAIVAVGAKAVDMASKFDAAARRIANTLPAMQGNVEGLKDSINALARESGVAGEELANAALAVARSGVASQEELIARLRVVQQLAETTGSSMEGLADSIDSALDIFNLSGDQFEAVAAKLFQMSRGRVGIEELTAALSRTAPVALQTGLSFDQMSRAIVALIAHGFKVRQAASQVEAYGKLGAKGAEQIRALADSVSDTGDALTEMHEAYKSVAESAEVAGKRIRENLNVTLREMGNILLPLVNKGLNTLLGLLSPKGFAAANFEHLTEQVAAFNTQAVNNKDARKALLEAATYLSDLGRGTPIGEIPDPFKQLDPEKAKQVADALDRFLATDKGRLASGYAALLKKVADQFGLVASGSSRASTALVDEWHKAIGVVTAEPPKPQSVLFGPVPIVAPEVIAARQKAEADERERQKQAVEAAKAQLEKVQQAAAPLLSAFYALNDNVVAALNRTIDEMVARYQEAIGPNGTIPTDMQGMIDALRADAADLGTFVDLSGQAEQLEEQAAAIDQFGTSVEEQTGQQMEMLPSIEELITRTEAYVATLDKESARYRQAIELLKRLTQLQGKALGNIGKAPADPTGDAKDYQKKMSAAREIQQAIGQAAVGALKLAEAFGLADESTSEMLQNIVTIATTIPVAVEALNGIQTAQKGATGDFIGAAFSILGAVASLFSHKEKSPEQVELERLQKANTAAIENLTTHLDKLADKLSGRSGTNIAGATDAIVASQQAYAEALRKSGATFGDVFDAATNALKQGLRDAGLSMQDFIDIANDLGIKFDESMLKFENYKQFYQQTKALLELLTSFQLDAFSKGVAGQLNALRLEFELFDISDPIAQLKRLQEVAVKAAGKVGGLGDKMQVFAAFGRFDLGTAEGRAQAEAYLQELFKSLEAGTITAAQLGDLSLDQLLDLLREMEGLIDEAAKETAPQGETQGFAVSRTITEAQGNVVISTLTTVAYWQEQLYRLIAGQGALVGTLAVPPLTATSGAGAFVPVDVTVNLTINGVLQASDATAVGQQVVDSMAARLDTLYGTKLRARRLAAGDVVRT